MKMKMKSMRGQGGFTLVELIIGMALMVMILMATGVFSFSGAQSKSTNILSVMKELGNAATRYNAHTGLMPKAPWSLFNKDKNLAADTFQGAAATTSWKGPYVNGFTAGTAGEYNLDSFVSGASITFAKITTGLPAGASAGYESSASAIPNEIVNQIVADCNGTAVGATLPTTHANGEKCTGTNDAVTGLGTVKYLFTSM